MLVSCRSHKSTVLTFLSLLVVACLPVNSSSPLAMRTEVPLLEATNELSVGIEVEDEAADVPLPAEALVLLFTIDGDVHAFDALTGIHKFVSRVSLFH